MDNKLETITKLFEEKESESNDLSAAERYIPSERC